jgi:hypothetical protein
MIASTTYPIRWICGTVGQNGNSQIADADSLLDISVGAATESVVIPNIHLNWGGVKDIKLPRSFGPIPFDAPAGSRIAVRSQCSDNNSIDRLIYLVLHGIGG